ncbi:MAG TPA: hypothetical protein ENJ93_05875 [Chloroflexi bacterium]|nr:hypothetical protein [Chloroflexota bacterium]
MVDYTSSEQEPRIARACPEPAEGLQDFSLEIFAIFASFAVYRQRHEFFAALGDYNRFGKEQMGVSGKNLFLPQSVVILAKN